MKHTPGPWEIQKAGKYGYWISAEKNYPKCPVEPLDEDAAFGAIDNDCDAYLIAAAPDMLAALNFLDQCSAPMTSQQEECWKLVRAAIAKATGGAS